MRFTRLRGATAAVTAMSTLVIVAACGGTTSGGNADGGTGGTAGTGGTSGTSSSGTGSSSGDTCGGAHPAPIGRPQPVACAAHSDPLSGDGGPQSCSTLADCQPDGSITFFAACLHGVCSVDACLTDSDCGAGKICGCEGDLGGGVARLGNECVATMCQVDSDCGGGQVCSESSTGGCGELDYVCHTPSDECLTDSDCCGSTPVCAYQPTLGHWACEGATACAG